MKKKTVLRLWVLACCAGAMLISASCVTSTAPDGAVVKRVDHEAVSPWLFLARDLFGPKGEPLPEAPVPVIVRPSK